MLKQVMAQLVTVVEVGNAALQGPGALEDGGCS